MSRPATPYRLGFLLCDHALGHLAARYGDYPLMFERAFSEVSDAINWQVYDVTNNELPAALDDCDGYLISGSRHGAYDDLPWIEPLCALIRALGAADKPLVGLCFGHQVIAHALGAEVRKAAAGWGIGIHAYSVETSAAWMTPALRQFVVPVCHQDQVLSLPAGAARLARSAHCENFVVQFAPRVLGIQGHPEFDPTFVAELVAWRRDSLPPTVYTEALGSLERAHDNRAVKIWIARFLGIPLREDT